MWWENILNNLLTVLLAVGASSGFWAYLQSRRAKKDYAKDMLMGLAHDRLMHLGMVYIERGWITEEEYENYDLWLYTPYERLKGNGAVKRIKVEVDKLPVRKSWISPLITNNEKPA